MPKNSSKQSNSPTEYSPENVSRQRQSEGSPREFDEETARRETRNMVDGSAPAADSPRELYAEPSTAGFDEEEGEGKREAGSHRAGDDADE